MRESNNMKKACQRMFVVVFTCAGFFLLPGLQHASGQTTFQAYGQPQALPAFSLEDLQGKRVDIRDHRGQVILLNFWATWCPNCRQEGPSIGKFYALYKTRGLILYRVDSKENPQTVRQFLEKESLEVPVLLDRDGRVERLLGVWVHPTSYLIGRKGTVCYRVMGVWDWTSFQGTSVIDQLLNER